MIELVWITGLLLALAAGLWLVVGSQRGSRGVQLQERRKLNAEAFKQQRETLEQRARAEELNAQQHAEALAQLEQTFAAEMHAVAPEQSQWTHRSWSLVQKLALCAVPVALAALTFQLSHGAQHFAAAPPVDADQQPSLEELVTALHARLQEQPDDPQGWMMLGRSYSVMGRHADAAQAYARANALTAEGNPDLLVAQAEALGLANGQQLDAAALSLIDKALALEPGHLRGLWYALLAAAQRGDDAAQTRYIERLRALPDLPDEMATWLRAEFGVEPTASADEVDAQDIRFEIDVALTPEAQSQVAQDATLFVFVRALHGPPMPLAVSRQALPQSWPVRVTLDDSMRMLENTSLASFDAWTVVARISRSGQAQAQSGDWQASVTLNEPPDGILDLTIEQQLP